jgi:hypothetical protein
MKFFTDRKFLPPGISHSVLLKPFWGGSSDHDGFLKFFEWAKSAWQLVAVDEAEAAILPFDGVAILHPKEPRGETELRQIAQEFVNLAQSNGLTTVVIVHSDSSRQLGLGGDVLVLRTSLDRRTRKRNEFALMATHEDIVATHLSGNLPLREYDIVPTVSFCGHVASYSQSFRYRLKCRLESALRRFGIVRQETDGMWLRRRAMQHLEASDSVKTSFIKRQEYFAGTVTETEARASERREYIENMLHSDYVLCVRGYGNYSFRFFEAMSLGRTPILVDTECVLPFEFLHDYAEIIVIVPAKKLAQIADRVREFHTQFAAGGYEVHQLRIRRFWEDWLSPKGYFSNLPALLKTAREAEAGSGRPIGLRSTPGTGQPAETHRAPEGDLEND